MVSDPWVSDAEVPEAALGAATRVEAPMTQPDFVAIRARIKAATDPQRIGAKAEADLISHAPADLLHTHAPPEVQESSLDEG